MGELVGEVVVGDVVLLDVGDVVCVLVPVVLRVVVPVVVCVWVFRGASSRLLVACVVAGAGATSCTATAESTGTKVLLYNVSHNISHN